MKRKIKFIYRLLFVIISGICVGIHFNMNDQYYNAHSFSYFTVQSNIFCLVMMCILLIKEIDNESISNFNTYFWGMSLSAIVCTCFIYTFADSVTTKPLLPDNIFSIPFTSLLSHYVVPFMFVIDWLLFHPKGNFKWRYIAGWLLFPIIYFIGFILRCLCNSNVAFIHVNKYPYFFLNYESLGLDIFFGYIVLILAIMIFINTLIIISDKFLYNNSK